MKSPSLLNEFGSFPEGGHFGPYGGRFVPEALITALDELEAAYLAAKVDPIFLNELAELNAT